MSTNRDDVTRLLEARRIAWEARDPDALAASHAEDGTVLSPIFGAIAGKESIAASYRDLFRVFQDWVYEGEAPIVDGDRVAQPFRVTATHSSELFGVAATGRRLEIHGALLFDIADGKIRHERRLYDFTGMLVQLGVLKAKPKD